MNLKLEIMRKEIMKYILFGIGLVLALMLMFSCKKEEVKQTQPPFAHDKGRVWLLPSGSDYYKVLKVKCRYVKQDGTYFDGWFNANYDTNGDQINDAVHIEADFNNSIYIDSMVYSTISADGLMSLTFFVDNYDDITLQNGTGDDTFQYVYNNISNFSYVIW
jgi:hypothetical protein